MATFDRFYKKGDAVLVALLASGAAIKDAAKAAGVSERTARRRLKEQEFCRMVSEARAALISEATGTLAASVGEAASTLKNLLGSTDDRIRLGAARAIVLLALKTQEVGELQQEVAELKGALRAEGVIR